MKLIKAIRMLGVATLTVVALGSLSAKAGDKLRIGTEGAYPPFNFVDSKGELQGFDVDIAKALCAEMKADCTFVKQDWDGIIPALMARKFDAIVASMSITEERKKAVDFSERYYTNKLQFIGKKGQMIDISAAGLKGKSIGAQRATISSSWLEKHRTDAKTKLYDTQENAYLDLASGRLDAILADVFVNAEWLQTDAGKDFEFKGEPVFKDDLIGIAVRKGQDDLRLRLNAAIKAIVANGTYGKINAKYFPVDIY
ncbi:ABC transporter substrate-binding protein [Magnetospira sp. QH-2]|uniref:ABC transporter substrate-binding protein n=1 Tax=Magnetospira sp. (strain QH-2) TaxID=1288970 RepID=UPI0003E81646|nr:ABC transporter substrate-binding protein [Magnetospira sp. QH-2]CCQ75396.1 putative ABC-type amino acid transporter periplasmic binding protein [Magnetospira sp. QH-2]